MKLTVLFLLFIAVLAFTDGKSHKKEKERKHSKHSESHLKKSSSSEEDSDKAAQYKLFSTSTAYDTVRGDVKQPDCKPVKMWAFIRHGTRYPHIEEMDRYRKLGSVRDSLVLNHSNGKGKLDKSQLKLFKKWVFKGTNEQEMHLTSSGYEELVGLGKRLQQNFPDLLDKKNLQSINMKRTNADRTTESGAAVTQGLFGYAMILPNSTVDDNLLKSGKKCAFWKTTTKSPELKKNIEEYKNSQVMTTLVKNVNKRLGFENELTYDTIKDMYDVCGFETSWYHGEYSTWCAAFSTEELQYMEYLEDLTYYWKSGFGNSYTSKLGCELVRDMITKLDSSNNLQNANLYFGHSLGNRQLLVSLGIGKCINNLSGNGYISPDARNNCWRTSKLTPFSANVMSVLYSCKTKGQKTNKLGVYVNEKIVKLPFCNGQELCDENEFKKQYSSLIDQSYCNRDFCSATSRSRAILDVLSDEDSDYEEDD